MRATIEEMDVSRRAVQDELKLDFQEMWIFTIQGKSAFNLISLDSMRMDSGFCVLQRVHLTLWYKRKRSVLPEHGFPLHLTIARFGQPVGSAQFNGPMTGAEIHFWGSITFWYFNWGFLGSNKAFAPYADLDRATLRIIRIWMMVMIDSAFAWGPKTSFFDSFAFLGKFLAVNVANRYLGPFRMCKYANSTTLYV